MPPIYRTNTTLRSFLWVIVGLMALLVAITLFTTLSIQQITGQNQSPTPPQTANPQTTPSPEENSPDDSTTYLVPAGRSPLAQSGEQFTSPNPPSTIDSTPPHSPTNSESKETTATKSPPDFIPWDQAIHYIGQTITVQGRIVDAYADPKTKVCFLNFTTYRNGSFYVLILPESLNAWPQPPNKFFLNKTIRVTGKVFARSHRSQIRVLQPSQIAVIE